MSYRKLKADLLFDGFKIITQPSVLICEQDGTVIEIVDEWQAGEGLEIFNGMLSPGFINCHCHLELSHLHGYIPEKKGLVNFVISVVSQRNQAEESKWTAMNAAENSMIESGIVAVGDICNSPDTIALKSFRKLRYYNFIEVLGWLPALANGRFENAEKTAAAFFDSGTQEEYLALCPHAPYSISENLWNLLIPGFKGKTISIHNQESQAENEFFQSGKGDLERMYSAMKMDSDFFMPPGMNSLPYIFPKLKLAKNLILVHNTFTQKIDLQDIMGKDCNPFFCLCPNANMYIENRLPDIPMFMGQSLQMVLGTDSLASNNQLSILEEMKTIKKHFPTIPTSTLLVWACSNGARALSFENTLGDFSKGKKPGIVLIQGLEENEITEQTHSHRLL